MHPLSQFKYCPKCGSSCFEINNEKSKKCSNCGFIYYFNSSASVVGFILNEKKELLICKRAKEPAKGTWDLPGGFIDMYETAEEGIAREIKEETGLEVLKSDYLFSIPNIYEYSGFPVHTLDLFFRVKVENQTEFKGADDVEEAFFISIEEINPQDFGLASIRKGVIKFLEEEL